MTRKEAKSLGLLRYRTGVECVRGHVADRLVSNGNCLACVAENKARLYAADPEGHRAKVAAYRANNADKVHVAKLASREKYREVSRAYAVRYRQEKREERREGFAKWRAQNVERERERARAFRDANPMKVRQYCANRRARLRNAEGQHTAEDVERLGARQKGRCAGCKRSLRRGFHVDHVLPLALNGSNAPANLQLLCGPCNMSKGRKHPVEWAQSCGRLV